MELAAMLAAILPLQVLAGIDGARARFYSRQN